MTNNDESRRPTVAKSPQPHPDHDRGLEFDLSTLLSRRRTLGVLFGGAAATALAACIPDGFVPPPGTTTNEPTPTSASPAQATVPPAGLTTPSVTRAIAECGIEITEETAGPFPGDGSNGPNVLEASGVVRQDITTSFGTSNTKATGVPLTVTLTLLDNSSGCKPLAGAAVYVWHCDSEGRYSMYDTNLEHENYLRGVQETDPEGRITFTTIFPGAYRGRWPHIHFEVFEALNNATNAGQILRVSQIALPETACADVYATAGYETSARVFPRTPLHSDMVFGDDGAIHQLATMTGATTTGYTATLNVTV
ncbi:protocatechuate 3,4-dioxygenase beta subunit [Arthrobacter sp. 1088]|uniref:dioxygenase family protein n=1 Tax=Arthrobacter sp. 1088 TaxID=2817768 RepID=UPI0028577CAD|nr:3,4-dioxygenase subunit beta [Arthrobacter sp. 1088]MDR6688238.1 protocatechuate 3,4-dioxygenase beta subunit [Arthrobacter sp. 1088]